MSEYSSNQGSLREMKLGSSREGPNSTENVLLGEFEIHDEHEHILKVVATSGVELFFVAEVYDHATRAEGLVQALQPTRLEALVGLEVHVDARAIRTSQCNACGCDDESVFAISGVVLGVAKVFVSPRRVLFKEVLTGFFFCLHRDQSDLGALQYKRHYFLPCKI